MKVSADSIPAIESIIEIEKKRQALEKQLELLSQKNPGRKSRYMRIEEEMKKKEIHELKNIIRKLRREHGE